MTNDWRPDMDTPAIRRGAVLEVKCDYCGEAPGLACRVVLYERGKGSRLGLNFAHIARRMSWFEMHDTLGDLEEATAKYQAQVDAEELDDLMGRAMMGSPNRPCELGGHPHDDNEADIAARELADLIGAP